MAVLPENKKQKRWLSALPPATHLFGFALSYPSLALL
jgi:hypothetical protein